MTETGISVDVQADGALWRVLLATPKANILDMVKIKSLTALFEKARDDRNLKVVLLEGVGAHFSFGASVEEHLPGQFEVMIPAFRRLLGALLDANVTCLAVVRGQCLGGGLELASLCHRVFASPDARLGQPEILLGVFAPVASVVLARRIGQGRAEDLCLSGRTLHAEEAQRIGLVDVVVQDPLAAAHAYAREHLLPRSAASLRLAVQAVRSGFRRSVLADLEEVERLYLGPLMQTHDATEGLRAFLAKRPPEWTNS